MFGSIVFLVSEAFQLQVPELSHSLQRPGPLSSKIRNVDKLLYVFADSMEALQQ